MAEATSEVTCCAIDAHDGPLSGYACLTTAVLTTRGASVTAYGVHSADTAFYVDFSVVSSMLISVMCPEATLDFRNDLSRFCLPWQVSVALSTLIKFLFGTAVSVRHTVCRQQITTDGR